MRYRRYRSRLNNRVIRVIYPVCYTWMWFKTIAITKGVNECSLSCAYPCVQNFHNIPFRIAGISLYVWYANKYDILHIQRFDLYLHHEISMWNLSIWLKKKIDNNYFAYYAICIWFTLCLVLFQADLPLKVTSLPLSKSPSPEKYV